MRKVVLSDEQVDLLNQNAEVADARRAYLRRLAEGFRASDPAIVAEANGPLREKYEALFEEKLTWVVENPPSPKTKPVFSPGFARRA